MGERIGSKQQLLGLNPISPVLKKANVSLAADHGLAYRLTSMEKRFNPPLIALRVLNRVLVEKAKKRKEFRVRDLVVVGISLQGVND